MSDAAETIDRPAGVPLVELERRATLARDPHRLDVQEQLDWARSLLASGDRAAARLLVEAAAIQQGFSPQLERARANLLAAVGLGSTPDTDDRAKPQGNTVDIAIAELRMFAETFGSSIAAVATAGVRPPAGKPGLHPTAALRRSASLPAEDGVGDLVARAFAWLRPGAEAPDDAAGAAAIAALRGPERDPGRWTVAGLAGADTSLLTSAAAVSALRGFLRAHADLLLPRLGSPALFRATAVMNSSGLGPYLANVGQIVRSSANLFELAAIASEAAGIEPDVVVEEAWVALLSRNVSGWLRFDIIDELGDRDASLALTIILERAVAVAADDIDRSLVERIRDAALDNLDYGLAAAAQQVLLTLSHGSGLERRIMGAIQASAGRIAAADQLLSACLNENPGDDWLRREVEANRERRYAPFALTKGFGSPPDRQLKRQRRVRRRLQASGTLAGDPQGIPIPT